MAAAQPGLATTRRLVKTARRTRWPALQVALTEAPTRTEEQVAKLREFRVAVFSAQQVFGCVRGSVQSVSCLGGGSSCSLIAHRRYLHLYSQRL
jgi:hypothetical protein